MPSRIYWYALYDINLKNFDLVENGCLLILCAVLLLKKYLLSKLLSLSSINSFDSCRLLFFFYPFQIMPIVLLVLCFIPAFHFQMKHSKSQFGLFFPAENTKRKDYSTISTPSHLCFLLLLFSFRIANQNRSRDIKYGTRSQRVFGAAVTDIAAPIVEVPKGEERQKEWNLLKKADSGVSRYQTSVLLVKDKWLRRKKEK